MLVADAVKDLALTLFPPLVPPLLNLALAKQTEPECRTPKQAGTRMPTTPSTVAFSDVGSSLADELSTPWPWESYSQLTVPTARPPPLPPALVAMPFQRAWGTDAGLHGIRSAQSPDTESVSTTAPQYQQYCSWGDDAISPCSELRSSVLLSANYAGATEASGAFAGDTRSSSETPSSSNTHAEEVARRACADSASMATKWHVDESWTALRWRPDGTPVSIKLDAESAANLTREEWAARFNRREHQLYIAKRTAPYRAFQEHIRKKGRVDPADPVTPRALAQTSKKHFESSYLQWRLDLHEWYKKSKSERRQQSSTS